MYSSGMGGACSSLSIASHLSDAFPGTSFLVLTDLPVFGRFKLPRNLDYVHIPRVAAGIPAAEEPTSRLDSNAAVLEIRRNVISAAVESYGPHFVIVDRLPLGIECELYEPLTELRRRDSRVRIVAGLRDLVGDPALVRAAWAHQGGGASIDEVFDEVFDEVWLYGARQVFGSEFDPSADFPNVVYMGYLRHEFALKEARSKLVNEGVSLERPLVLVTVGGGREGYRLVDHFFSYLESRDIEPDFETHVVCGPLMSTAEKKALDARAARLAGVSIDRFHKDLTPYVRSASVVVSTFGYNTACQILSFRKRAVVVPRMQPNRDELLRARAFDAHGLVEMIHPDALVPALLGEKVLDALNGGGQSVNTNGYHVAPLDGLENIAKRIIEHAPVN